MGVLLFCLAVVMIVGGGAAVYSGSLIVSVERGWSMMISGSVCASAGVIVLGLFVVAGRLRRISHQTEVLSETMSRIEMSTWGPPPPLLADEVEEARPVVRDRVPDRSTDSAELISHPAVSSSPVEPPPTVVEALPEPETSPPSFAEPVVVQDPEPPEATIVGSYSAGDNAYLMYSDGSIQADTPEGRFRFGSLDELKAYVADGERKTRESRSIVPEPHMSPATTESANA